MDGDWDRDLGKDVTAYVLNADSTHEVCPFGHRLAKSFGLRCAYMLSALQCDGYVA